VDVAQGEGFVVPLQCRQCEDAPCIKICPTNALFRADDESPVVIDHDLCIGCKWCVIVCPFGVITLDEKSRTIVKCDQCFERLKRNELPACVVSCPTGALEFKTLEGVVAEKRREFLVRIECGPEGDDR
jgi:carbon-monoxide dehydrogenase iron sulfur subunit